MDRAAFDSPDEQGSPRRSRTDTGLAWDLVAQSVERLIDAWELGGEPPRLAEFLPDARPKVVRLAVVELIKVDLEYRWRNGGTGKRIEEYHAELRELFGERVPCDLIYEEFHVRRQNGDPVEAADYYARFPEQATELARLLGAAPEQSSSSMFAAQELADVRPGDRLDDFDLLSELGRGAFATVFLAWQRSMPRQVALKVSADRGSESQTLARLDHPQIVRVFDQRQLAERRLRLLSMQYVSGGTLQEAIRAVAAIPATQRTGKLLVAAVDQALERRGEGIPSDSAIRQRLAAMSWPDAVCWIGARLAEALDYAHGRGVLHRDVKPANVLLSAECLPLLADFNISFDSKRDGATPAAYFGGSLAYMSPEQLEASNPAHDREPESLDAKADAYSLSVVLWELLTGSRPFPDDPFDGNWSETLAAMTARRRAGLSADAAAQLATSPDGLRAALATCLSPRPEDRFASAGELAERLELCLHPRVERLLTPPRRGWRRVIHRWPVAALIIGGVLPNAVLSAINIAYNVFDIIKDLHQSAQDVFFDRQLVILNSIFYSLGVAGGLLLARPTIVGLGRFRRGETPPPESAAALRRQSLWLGDWIAWIGLSAWILSGVAFPLGLSESMQPRDYAHFMTSQVLCGLMAATLSFFSITSLSVRGIFPGLLAVPRLGPSDADEIRWLQRRLWTYFGLTVAVPLVAVNVLVLIGTNLKLAFGVLGGVGLANFALTLGLFRSLQRDLEGLLAAAAAREEST